MTAVERRIARYADETADLLPFWARKSAKRDLTNTVYSMLQDYTDGEEADLQDVRDILNELGSPDSMADHYYARMAHKTRRARRNIRHFMNGFLTFLTLIAAAFIIIGAVVLATGLSNNMMPVVFGGILALLAVIARGVSSPETEYR